MGALAIYVLFGIHPDVDKDKDLGCNSTTTVSHYFSALSATIVKECRNMPAILKQSAFDGIVSQCER